MVFIYYIQAALVSAMAWAGANEANQSDGFSVARIVVQRYATTKHATPKPRVFAALCENCLKELRAKKYTISVTNQGRKIAHLAAVEGNRPTRTNFIWRFT